MADRNQWTSMSGSSRFGIYRESPSKHRRSAGGRFCCSLAIFLVITTVICLTALSITTGKGRKRVKVVRDRSPENGKILVNSTGKSLVIEEMTTPSPAYNATEVGHHQEPSEPSMPRPEVVVPSMLNFPEDHQEEHATGVYLPEDEETSSSNEEASFASRQGRIMNEPAVSPYKMRSPPRFLNPPADQRPNVLVFSTPSGGYTDNFAQMGPFTNRYDNMKNSQELLDYAADDRPIPIFPQIPTIKFTGVYVRGPAEEIQNINLDKKKQLNGHAYSATTDPFRAYKPAHPAEINHLATTTSDLDTGIRFSNKIVRASPTSSPQDDMGASGTGTLTQAIFHPYDSVTSSSRDKKARPLKIMLDIYPVHQSDSLEQGSVQVVEGERQRKPVAVRPPLTLPPVAPPPPVPPPVPPPTQPSRMIVHLNLFPKKSQKNSSQRRATPLPTAITLVPGGGSQFQDRIFDSIERPVTTHVSFPVRRSGDSRNDSSPDESIEIAERYPVSAADAGAMDRNSRATFLMRDDQVMEHSAPYSFVIGRANSRNGRDDVDQDDGGGEGGVFIMEDMEEFQGEDDRSPEQADEPEETDRSQEDTEGTHGERTAFRQEEDTGNGYKVVSFQVSGDMVDDEVIDDRGILRAGKPEENLGGSSYSPEGTHGLISGETHGSISDGHSTYRPDDVYKLIAGGRGSNRTPGTTHGAQPNHKEPNQGNPGPDTNKGIRIQKINPPRFFPQPANGAVHDVSYEDDKVPIGTVSEMTSELEAVPGYNEGAIIEPRADVIKANWPRMEMLNSNTTFTTGRPIVFPTSPSLPTQRTTEEILLVEEPTTIGLT